MSDNLCSYILFDGGGLPLAAAPAPSLSYLHLSIRWAVSSATPSAGARPRNAPNRSQLTAVNPAKAGSSFFSSKRTVLQNVMLTKVSIGCPH